MFFERLKPIKDPTTVVEWNGIINYMGEDSGKLYFTSFDKFTNDPSRDSFESISLLKMASAQFSMGNEIPEKVEVLINAS